MAGTHVARPVDNPVAASTSPGVLFDGNPARLGFTVHNDTAGDLLLKFTGELQTVANGGAALSVSTTSFHVKIAAGGYYEQGPVGLVTTGRIEAVGTVAVGTWRACGMVG